MLSIISTSHGRSLNLRADLLFCDNSVWTKSTMYSLPTATFNSAAAFHVTGISKVYQLQKVDLKDRLRVQQAGRSPRYQTVPSHIAKMGRTNAAEFEGGVARRWRELHGENNWHGLLTPLSLDLRKELLRYGDFVQVTEDAFPWEPKSRYPFACPYKKKDVLDEVGLPETGYEVTRYLYSYLRGDKPEGPVQEVNWIGYVAVTCDPEEIKRLGRRDIIVAWRGTRTTVEWAQDNLFRQMEITSINGKEPANDVRVAEGFWRAFADEDGASPFLGKGSAGKQATQEVKRLLQKYEGEEMSITCIGHSLGGALATFCAYQIAEDCINETPSGTVPVAAITFASPRVGTTNFSDRFKSLGVKHLRIKSNQDVVPCFPLGNDKDSNPLYDAVKQLVVVTGKLIHLSDVLGFLVSKMEEATKFDGFAHVGTTLSLDYKKSPYMKQASTPADVNNAEVVGNHHNLQGYLHLVNGIVGTDHDLEKPFHPVVTRDLAIINKSANILVDQYAEHVPGMWWRMRHNGLVRNSEGFFVFPYLFDPKQGSNEDFD